MTDTPDLVTLLYRADWTRLSLAAEVSSVVDHDLAALRSETGVPGAESPPGAHGPHPGSGWRGRPTGHEWAVATDLQGTESSRSTLLVAPGRRYRHQEDGFIRGCDGDRSWQELEDDRGWMAELSGDPRPPLRTLLRPSWLLTGFTLEILGPVTACGREALRVSATPRRSTRDGAARWHQPLDRVDVIVDAELGILLRHEEIFEGKPLKLTEVVDVSFNPAEASDDAQFAPPSGWEAAEKNGRSISPGGLGWEVTKLATGLAAGGLGALIRSSPPDPFGQATREEPEAAMPEDESLPPGASPVSDEVLHLLYASQGRWAPGIEATMHQWRDFAAMLSQVPDRDRQAGFGGLGSLVDTAGRRMPATHTVSRLRIGGPDRYRIDTVVSPRQPGPTSTVCDGQRCWNIFDDEVTVGTAAPPPREIADLFDASWLLESQLTGGTETVIEGRRGYRLAVSSDDPRWRGMSWPDEVVVDAELGFLLRWISHLGPQAVARYELRDITANPGELGDFSPDLPPGTRVVEESPREDVPPGPVNIPATLAGAFARQAAKDARSAVQGFLGFIRGGDARLSRGVAGSSGWPARPRKIDCQAS
jgi:hypothetical protein